MDSDSYSENRKNFIRLANKRVNNVLNQIRLVGNLSNTSNYNYTSEDIKKIFDVLESELQDCKKKFEKKKKEKPAFSLDE